MGQVAKAGAPSPLEGRLFIVLAAVLWSSSGFFTKLLTKETSFGLHEPQLDDQAIAFYRVLFAGAALLPTLRRRDLAFRGTMVVSALSFASMNAMYVSAMVLGVAANAVLLQYTAPLWVYLASVFWLREKADWRNSIAVLTGVLGIAIIVSGGWNQGQLFVIALGLGSGVGYAAVLVCLRLLRDLSSRWLTVWNLLWSAALLLPFMAGQSCPSPLQFAVLFVFGTVQLALPYWLVARGLRTVSSQEAAAITLLEPILVAVWAYLVSPETESLHWTTFAGGAMILGGLAWRYWPRRHL